MKYFNREENSKVREINRAIRDFYERIRDLQDDIREFIDEDIEGSRYGGDYGSLIPDEYESEYIPELEEWYDEAEQKLEETIDRLEEAYSLIDSLDEMKEWRNEHE